ncbi:hypothetical protein NESM_000520500 [Novymonas esmeraldas]|uniref:Uncharacterized protein n=1 Tax=Novymonas esmeraldas TaxID=1808958 RepID=A0AAW0EQ92_9TRYP
MHLSHQIPWNGASRHFQFVPSHKALYGHPSGLFPRNEERQESDLWHFIRVVADTVVEFATTERRKYPGDMTTSAPLFSDELLDAAKYELDPHQENCNRCIPIHAEMQSVSYWQHCAGDDNTSSLAVLGDAVKFLIQQDQSRALLSLSQAIPMSSLFHLSWGHSFGVSLVAVTSMRLYILLNLAYAVQQQQRLSAKKLFCIFDVDELRCEVLECFSDHDFSAQMIMHRQFWQRYVDNIYGPGEPVFRDPAEVDMDGLRAYLSHCFRVVYLYDMIARESGDADTVAFWREEVRAILHRTLHTPELTMP